MEEVKEVLVEEVNTSTSNQRKKEAFISSLKYDFKSELINLSQQIAEYKQEIYNNNRRILDFYRLITSIESIPNKSILEYSYKIRRRYTEDITIFRNRLDENYNFRVVSYKNIISELEKEKKNLAPKVRRFVADFDNMANLLDSNYGENGWDIIGSNIYIHFSGFYIKNNTSKNYIKDLYTIISFYKNEDVGFKLTLWGRRVTLSPMEYVKNYSHSHLSQGGFNIGKFCLGSGPITQTLSVLQDTYTDDLFQLFLYQINEYIQWESLEGGPYRKIRNLYANTKVSYDRSLSRIDRLYKEFISKKVKYSISVSSNNIQVHIDEEDFMKKMYLSISDQVIKFEGSYYRGSIIEEMPRSFRPYELFTFNGVSIKTKVELTKSEYAYETTVHPQIIWCVKERIIRNITKKSKIVRNSDGSGSSNSNEEKSNVETMVHNI